MFDASGEIIINFEYESSAQSRAFIDWLVKELLDITVVRITGLSTTEQWN